MNYDTVSRGLWRLTNWFSAHEIWDGGMAFTWGPIFQEAYAIRAALIAGRVLGVGRVRDVATAFCDRALSTQGVVETDMYYMGYGNQRNAEGVPNCSCVADACSTAAAILATVQSFPESDRNERYRASVRRFCDYVLAHYRHTNGAIGVGILGHRVNPMPEYWCANALFAPVLIGLADVGCEPRYAEAACGPLTYLATCDFRNLQWNEWKTCATEVIFYSGEGLLDGLLAPGLKEWRGLPAEGPGVAPAGAVSNPSSAERQQALNRVKAEEPAHAGLPRTGITGQVLLRARWQEFVEWLYRNQEANGIWQDPRDYRCYQCGLGWLLQRSEAGLEHDPRQGLMIDRQLNGLLSSGVGKGYHGLFCRPFATALAYLSFAGVAEGCLAGDPDGFRAALARAQAEECERWW